MEAHGPSITVPSSLAYFCVYNPNFGPTEETQKDQLLYYVAKKTVPMDVKMRQIGLAQGLIHFTRVFSPLKPCENVHTQKNRLTFYEPEPNYWIHISIELSYIKKIIKDKDGKPKTIVEYLDSNLHDSGIKRMLQLGYGMYKMFNGPFDLTVHTVGIKALKNKLEEFFANWVFNWDFDKMDIAKTIDGTSYLPLSSSARKQITSFTDKFHSEYDFISDILILKNNKLVCSGKKIITEDEIRELLRYLFPLISERNKFEIEIEKQKNKEGEKYYTFKDFTRTLSGGNLFAFFSSPPSNTTPKCSPSSSPTNNTEIPNSTFLSPPLSTPFPSLSPSPSPSSSSPLSISNFLIGPQNLQGGTDGVNEEEIKPTTIYLNKKSIEKTIDEECAHNVDEYYLLSYKKNSITIVFLIPHSSLEGSKKIHDITFYRSIDTYLSSQTEDLINILNEEEERTRIIGTEIDKEYRYLLFNKITLAVKSSLYVNNITYPSSSSSSNNNNNITYNDEMSPLKGLTITNEMAHSLCDLHEDLEKFPHITEIYTRSSSNFWIVGKRIDGRVLYVVVPKKEASLTEVEEDVRRLISLYFSGTLTDNFD
ncbi:hypothetical protein Glove_302g22 [Diversispora epigaea]|uniref:CCZ1/INTU/HSP4 first Longin domain-containing protein n=1 Tax=Diversispora epigaea TaxID=1348612 RepID=A0A397HVK9_9GLOM|nr:hypothetical protein Glove_302g22 [Diversispora epigaea]